MRVEETMEDVLLNYFCEGQMTIFDFLEEHSESVKAYESEEDSEECGSGFGYVKDKN